jgi:hypothetical protein
MARPLAMYVNPYLDGKVYVGNIAGATEAIGYREEQRPLLMATPSQWR